MAVRCRWYAHATCQALGDIAKLSDESAIFSPKNAQSGILIRVFLLMSRFRYFDVKLTLVIIDLFLLFSPHSLLFLGSTPSTSLHSSGVPSVGRVCSKIFDSFVEYIGSSEARKL